MVSSYKRIISYHEYYFIAFFPLKLVDRKKDLSYNLDSRRRIAMSIKDYASYTLAQINALPDTEESEKIRDLYYFALKFILKNAYDPNWNLPFASAGANVSIDEILDSIIAFVKEHPDKISDMKENVRVYFEEKTN